MTVTEPTDETTKYDPLKDDDLFADVPSFDRDPDLPTKPIPLVLDGERFLCVPVIPAGATQDLARLSKASNNEQVVLFGQFLDTVLLPESAARFAQRIRQHDTAITNRQINQAVVYLVEKYGLRPTTPVSPSHNGATTGGTN